MFYDQKKTTFPITLSVRKSDIRLIRTRSAIWWKPNGAMDCRRPGSMAFAVFDFRTLKLVSPVVFMPVDQLQPEIGYNVREDGGEEHGGTNPHCRGR